MCQALRELMKDEIEGAENRAENVEKNVERSEEKPTL